MLQLKVVGPVAVLGGLLQIVLLMFLCGVTALVWENSAVCSSAYILAIWGWLLKLISVDICSSVEQGCRRVFLLVPFYPCHQLQWYFFLSFVFSSSIQKLLFLFPVSSQSFCSKCQFDQVVKFLVERNSTSSLHGQVTIGILIFQVSLITFYIYKLDILLYEVFVSFSNFFLNLEFSGLCCWFTICLASSFGW